MSSNHHRKDRPGCVVVDAFGTIAYLSRPTRPYARLRLALEAGGVDVSGFPLLAMTSPLGLAGMASHYGVHLPLPFLEAIEHDLYDEIASLSLSPGAVDALSRALTAGCSVVVGSNLALPYGSALKVALSAAGLELGAINGAGKLRAAFSYEMGYVKPQPEFYDAVADAVGEAPCNILMLGDKLVEDHDAPARSGWRVGPATNRTADAAGWDQLFPRW